MVELVLIWSLVHLLWRMSLVLDSLLGHIHTLRLVRSLVHALDRLLNEAMRVILVERHLDMIILRLCEILTFHHVFVLRFWRSDVEVRLRNVISKTHLTLYLHQSRLKMIFYRNWQLRERRWVRHAQLVSFMDSLLNCVVVAESLPLSIHWVDTSSRKETLLDEPLPVHLVLVLLARVLLSDLEYFDQLSNCKPGPLPWKFLHLLELSHLPFSSSVLHIGWILDFHDDVLLHRQPLLLNMHVYEPLVRNYVARIVIFNGNLRSIFFNYVLQILVRLHHLKLFFNLNFWVFVNLDREAFHQMGNLPAVLLNELDVVFAHVWHVNDVRYETKNGDVFTK